MSPRYFFKKHTQNYYASPHFADTPEAKLEKSVEKKIELFCNTLKYAFLHKLRRKNG